MGNSIFIYGQSSLRIHHLNYFLHVFELFNPYISDKYIVKERKCLQQIKEQKFNIVQLIFKRYLYLVLISIDIIFCRQSATNNNKKMIPFNIADKIYLLL